MLRLQGLKRVVICCVVLTAFIVPCAGQSLDISNRSTVSFFSLRDAALGETLQDKKTRHLLQAYRSAIAQSPTQGLKMAKAKLALKVAKESGEEALLSECHTQMGDLYYSAHHHRKALDHYLLAFKFAQASGTSSLYYPIYFRIGLFKSSLENYEDAAKHFEACMDYYSQKQKTNEGPHPISAYTRAYLNSIHQASICYRHLKNYKKEDSLTEIGHLYTALIQGHGAEKNRFVQSKGIMAFRKHQYETSLELLNSTLPGFQRSEDFYGYTVSQYYLGKNYLYLQRKEEAMNCFMKADSVFLRHAFVFPELQESFRQLVIFYKLQNSPQQELYYQKKLLMIDRLVNRDRNYLAGRIQKAYDNSSLQEIHNRLETEKKWSLGATIGLLLFFMGFILMLWRLRIKKRKIIKECKKLETKVGHQKGKYLKKGFSPSLKKEMNRELYEALEQKLLYFEQDHQYRKKGITLKKLAKKFGTNSNYLSQVIHETRKVSFKRYLGELRIRYITERLTTEPHYLKYTVKALAEECGMTTRQNFSNLFQEINGMRPADFIKQRMEAAEQEKFEK